MGWVKPSLVLSRALTFRCSLIIDGHVSCMEQVDNEWFCAASCLQMDGPRGRGDKNSQRKLSVHSQCVDDV